MISLLREACSIKVVCDPPSGERRWRPLLAGGSRCVRVMPLEATEGLETLQPSWEEEEDLDSVDAHGRATRAKCPRQDVDHRI